MFKKINISFDFQQLRKDVLSVYKQIQAEALNTEYADIVNRNVCLTVKEPNSNDWTDGIAGKTFVKNTFMNTDLRTQMSNNTNEMIKEEEYIHPITQIKDTYLEQFIQSFDNVFRWRISVLPPRSTLSIHVDGSPYMNTLQGGSAVQDWRLHFPIKTNNRCFIIGWPDNFGTPSDTGEMVNLNIAHFKASGAYLLNTTVTHCATNYSKDTRIHLIASCSSQTAKSFE